VPAIVPTLGELLSQQPDSKFPVHDGKITTRCPRSDCFSLQVLSESSMARNLAEARYDCGACGTTMVIIRRTGAAEPELPLQATLGAFTYWSGKSGIHLRLANETRIRTRPLDGSA
jgi:hypothetical protein